MSENKSIVSVFLELDHAPDEYESAIINYCTALCDKLILKYLKGKIEHGGDPIEIDCQKEINDEVLDIINYHLINQVNQKKKESV